MEECIITADDFGLSRGVNEAIVDAHAKGALTHASLMVTMNYAQEAVVLAKKHPGLNVGLHLDLTCGEALATPEGFKLGFVGLLLKTLLGRKDKKLKCALYREVEAQIKQAQGMGITLSHIDGHRHIHMIPMIFSIVRHLAKKHGIARVRIVNESLFKTLSITRSLSFLWDGGLIKHFILKCLYWVNRTSCDLYFFSILHSCKITPCKLQKMRVPKGYTGLEIMLHPGRPSVDEQEVLKYEKEQLLSPFRELEYQSSLALKSIISDD